MNPATNACPSLPSPKPMAGPDSSPLGPGDGSICVGEGAQKGDNILQLAEPPRQTERLAYSIQEAADLLGVNYFSIYRLIQRGKLKACRALRGKLLIPRSELLKLLKTE